MTNLYNENGTFNTQIMRFVLVKETKECRWVNKLLLDETMIDCTDMDEKDFARLLTQQ